MTRTVDRTRGGAAVIALAVSLAGCTPAVADQPAVAPSGPAGPSAAVPSASAAAPVRSRPARIGYPAAGGDEWRFAAAEPATHGGTGRLLRYRVAVERDITGLPPADFAAQVTGILTGPGGWTTDGRIALRRVGARGPADFTVYLATPGTRDDLCGDGPDRYTSCRSAGTGWWSTWPAGCAARPPTAAISRRTAGTWSTTRSATVWVTGTSAARGGDVRRR